MARRRHRRHRRHSRRRNPLPLLANPLGKGDLTPVLVGAVGGALAIYLWLRPQLASASTTPAPATNTLTITAPTIPGLTTTTTTPGQ